MPVPDSKPETPNPELPSPWTGAPWPDDKRQRHSNLPRADYREMLQQRAAWWRERCVRAATLNLGHEGTWKPADAMAYLIVTRCRLALRLPAEYGQAAAEIGWEAVNQRIARLMPGCNYDPKAQCLVEREA